MSAGDYWSDVAESAGDYVAYPEWRAYCDELHRDLLDRWLGDERFSRALKTDLFDESVGAGIVPVLSRIAREVVGIDVAANVVERAGRRQPGLVARVEDIRRTSFDDASFDLVVSNSTLDHFESHEEIEASLREIVRILEPGGRLLLTLDNPRNPVLWARSRLPRSVFGRSSLTPYMVGRTLALDDMVRLLQRVGCDVRRTGHVMHVPRVLFLHLSRHFDPKRPAGRRLLRFMMGFEVLDRLPTAPFSGHFAAALAEKPR